MVGAYAIACVPGAAVREVTLTSYDQSSFKYATKSTLTDSSVSQFMNPTSNVLNTVCSFTRPWTATAAPPFEPSGGNFLLAIGKTDVFAHHATTGSPGGPVHTNIDFLTGTAISGGGSVPLTHFQKVVWTHGMLMTVGWGWIIPAGILVARFKLGASGLWFKVHRAGQVLGLLLGFVGLAVIVSGVREEKRAHFMVTHAKVGLAVMVAAGLQPLNALIKRPKPADGDHMSFNRMVWELVHKGIGYGTVVLAW
jgi:hypothetical protein